MKKKAVKPAKNQNFALKRTEAVSKDVGSVRRAGKYDRNGKLVKAANKAVDKVKKLNKKWLIVGVAAVLVLVLGGVGIWAAVSNRAPEVSETPTEVEEPEPEPTEPEPVVNTDPLVPEPTITDNAAYQVAGYKPRYISVPSVALYNIPIIEIGKYGNMQLGAPENARVVGWYYRSAIPGEVGASVMDGHGGDLGYGIFRPLPRAQIGDEIIIEMGDGRKFTYVITNMITKVRGPEADAYMDHVYQPLGDGKGSLTLITCTGQWIRAEQTYLLRLFVEAVLQK